MSMYYPSTTALRYCYEPPTRAGDLARDLKERHQAKALRAFWYTTRVHHATIAADFSLVEELARAMDNDAQVEISRLRERVEELEQEVANAKTTEHED